MDQYMDQLIVYWTIRNKLQSSEMEWSKLHGFSSRQWVQSVEFFPKGPIRVGVNSIPELELQLNSNSNSGIGIGIGIEIGGIENGIGIETPGIGIGIEIENRN